MHGTRILARTMTSGGMLDKAFRNRWQYHPRSDRHSKIACWGIMFDLLLTCRLLQQHCRDGRVGFGINHEMRDFRTGRKKKLDLVICTPGTQKVQRKRTTDLRDLVRNWAIDLDQEALDELAGLPAVLEAPVGEVQVALEAKACMTAHLKARPRLYDELSSSHQTVHGNSANAIAAGFVTINAAERFVSPDRNKWSLAEHAVEVSTHRQPANTLAVLEKMREIPRRTTTQETGFDALGVVVIDAVNDGTPFTIVTGPPAVEAGDVLHYDSMIRRAARLYESRFPQV